MGRITNKHILKIKELISDEVCMGTFGLVELELLEMEKDFPNQRIENTSSNSGYKRCEHDFEWSTRSKYGTCKKCGYRMHY